MKSGVTAPDTGAVAERALRRISLRVMPYVFLLYIVAFLDRVNVGYAALQMAGDWGSEGIAVVARGHINGDAGVGDWPEGRAWLQQLIARAD